MSRRHNKLVIFERQTAPPDEFTQPDGVWEEVTKAWVSMLPTQVDSQRTEFVDAQQNKSTRKSIVKTICTRTMLTVDSQCRMKLRKLQQVNPSEPESDENYRIFGIEQVVNVDEANREVQLMVIERV